MRNVGNRPTKPSTRNSGIRTDFSLSTNGSEAPMCSCRTIDYAGLYILPHGRIYERLQAGSIALGAHVRQCHSEPEDCKGLEHNQEMRFLDPRVHDTATRQGAAERSARLLIVRQHLVQQQRPPPFAPPTPIL